MDSVLRFFLLKFIEQGSKRSAALAILFLVLMSLSSWYYVVYCGLLSLIVIFWPNAHRQNGELAYHQMAGQVHIATDLYPFTCHLFRRIGQIATILIATIIILSPLLLPMFRLLSSTTLVGEHDPLRHSVDLYSFWVPGPPSTWASWFEDAWISYAAQNREPGASAYPGYIVLGLSLIGVTGRRWRRQALWWLLVALSFTVLALGPQLQIDGQILGITLPYTWLGQIIPFFSITGIPGRFVIMTSLALAILSTYGLVTLDSWLRRRNITIPTVSGRRSGVGPWLYLAAGLLVSLEYLALPLHLTRTDTGDFYHVLAADTELYTLIDIKWDANFLMHAQTVHGKPLVGGWLARLPEEQAAYLDQGSLDKTFLYLLLGPEGTIMSDPVAIQLAVKTALVEHNVRYIIDHNNRAGGWLTQVLNVKPVHFEGMEGDFAVYEIHSGN